MEQPNINDLNDQLLLAADNLDLETIKVLLKKGANIQHNNNYVLVQFNKHTTNENYDLISWMANPEFRKFYSDELILTWAVASGNISLIRYVKSQDVKGIKISDPNDILKYAIDNNEYKFIDQLNHIGYKLKIWENIDTSIEYAASKGNVDFIRRAIDNQYLSEFSINRLLRLGVINNHLNVVIYCDNLGADLFSTDCLAVRLAKNANAQSIVNYLETEMNKPYRLAIRKENQSKKNTNDLQESMQKIIDQIEILTEKITEYLDAKKDQ